MVWLQKFESRPAHILFTMKKLEILLKGETINVRKMRLSDAQNLYDNVKHKEVVKYTQAIPHPYPKDGAQKFIRSSFSNIKKNKAYELAIVLKESDKLIGIVSLLSVDMKNNNAELGYWLGKKHWGKGYVTQAVKLILDFGFNQLKLHRIYAKLFDKNIGSKKVLEKTGFKLEGTFKEHQYRHKKWQDVLRYGLLKKDYKLQ